MAIAIKKLVVDCINQEHRWKITLFQEWERIIGPMKENVSLECITNDCIYLGVTHPAWAQELMMLAPMLKRKINTVLQQERVKEIRFRILKSKKPIPTKKSDQETDSLQELDPKRYALNNDEHAHLEKVEDTELRASLQKFLVHCKKTKRS